MPPLPKKTTYDPNWEFSFAAQEGGLSCDTEELRYLAKKLDATRGALAKSAGATQKTAYKVRQNRTLGDLGYDAMITDARQHLNKFAEHVGKLADTALLVASTVEGSEAKVAGAMDRSLSKSGSGGISLDGSVVKGWTNFATHLFGIGATGSVSGELLQGDVKSSSEGRYDHHAGNLFLTGKNIKASGSLARGRGEVDYGYLHADGDVKFVTGAAQGTAAASLLLEGKFDPSVTLTQSARISAVDASVGGRLGTASYNQHVEAKGALLTAGEGTRAYIGKRGLGFIVDAEAAVARGEIWSGYTIMGVKADVGIGGSLLSDGFTVGFGADRDTKIATGVISAAYGAGATVEYRIDWSGLDKGIQDTKNYANKVLDNLSATAFDTRYRGNSALRTWDAFTLNKHRFE